MFKFRVANLEFFECLFFWGGGGEGGSKFLQAAVNHVVLNISYAQFC